MSKEICVHTYENCISIKITNKYDLTWWDGVTQLIFTVIMMELLKGTVVIQICNIYKNGEQKFVNFFFSIGRKWFLVKLYHMIHIQQISIKEELCRYEVYIISYGYICF